MLLFRRTSMTIGEEPRQARPGFGIVQSMLIGFTHIPLPVVGLELVDKDTQDTLLFG